MYVLSSVPKRRSTDFAQCAVLLVHWQLYVRDPEVQWNAKLVALLAQSHQRFYSSDSARAYSDLQPSLASTLQDQATQLYLSTGLQAP